MPGRDLWVVPGSFRDRRVPNFDVDRPGHQADVPGQHQRRHRVPARLRRWSSAPHYVHNNLGRTIEDIGAVDAFGNETYVIGNPGEGLATIQFAVRRHAARPAGAEAEAPVRRARADAQQALLEQLLLERQLRPEPPVRQLLGHRGERGDQHADDWRRVGHGAAAGGQHRAARRQRQPGLGHRRDLLGFARQPGRPRPSADGSPARREAVRRLPVAVRHPVRRRSSTAAAARR